MTEIPAGWYEPPGGGGAWWEGYQNRQQLERDMDRRTCQLLGTC